MTRREQVGAVLVVVGVLLLLNPFYLSSLLPYATAGEEFRLTAVYYAELSVLGLLAIGTGAWGLRREEPMPLRFGAGLAFAAVVVHVAINRLTNWVARSMLGTDAYTAFGGSLLNPISFPGSEGLFVEVVLASLFAIGLVLDGGTRRERAVVLVAVVVLLAVTAATGGIPMGAFGLAIAAVSADLLGIPLVGLVLLLLHLALGLGVNRYVYR